MKLDRSATESGSGGERGHTANIWVTGGVPIPASFGGSGGSVWGGNPISPVASQGLAVNGTAGCAATMLIDSIKTF
jgi:hypothetical protein